MCVCVIMAKCGLETPTVVGTTTEMVLSILEGVHTVCMILYRCVVDIKIKVEFEKGVWSKQVTLIFSASDIFSFCDFVIIKL